MNDVSTKRQTYLKGIALVLCCALLCGCSSCTKQSGVRFRDRLAAVDRDLKNKKDSVNKELSRLLKYANSPEDVLSIVKRQRSIGASFDSIQTLDEALRLFPDSAELAALLTITLMDEQRYEEARDAGVLLEYTPYMSIAAEASMRADKQNGSTQTSASLWEAAFTKTGLQSFLKNTALMYAMQGDMLKALEQRAHIPQKQSPAAPYFWSCLAFDLGFFQPVFDDLDYTLANADTARETNAPAKKYARSHLLLAADAAYGLGDIERARAFWQHYIDRFENVPPYIMYNMAVTADTQKDHVAGLVACLTKNPGYYPAAAEYIRMAITARDADSQDDAVTRTLHTKKIYSLEMEKQLFAAPHFLLTAEEVLNQARRANPEEPRFLLEFFRYNEQLETNSSRSFADIWQILEAYPDNAYVREYARWYFAANEDFNAAQQVGDIADAAQKAFYDGVFSSLSGQTAAALEFFTEAQKYPYTRLPAFINAAQIYAKLGKTDKAIESYLSAAQLTKNPVTHSHFEYEAARLLAENRNTSLAILHLHSAVDYNPENYPAKILLDRLTKTK